MGLRVTTGDAVIGEERGELTIHNVMVGIFELNDKSIQLVRNKLTVWCLYFLVGGENKKGLRIALCVLSYIWSIPYSNLPHAVFGPRYLRNRTARSGRVFLAFIHIVQ